MLWIVGNAYRDLRQYLTRNSIDYGILTNADRPNPWLQDVRTVALDYSTPGSLIKSAESAHLDVSALISAGYENYVLPAALLASHFRLPGLIPDAAQATTDKARMRTRFNDYDTTITPDFTRADSWRDIEAFMATHSYPVMLKPTNLMKSLYVTRNHSASELRTNYEALVAALAGNHKRPYTMEPTGIILEECMAGSMHTVAGYADADGSITLLDEVVDCITGQDIGKNENYLYSRQLPTRLNRDEVNVVLDVARRGAQALRLTSTMLHIEIILTPQGPKLVEIGARIGGYRTRMFEYSAGIDMNAVMLDLAFGRTPVIPPHRARSVAFIELFPDAEGRFVEFENLAAVERLPSFRYAGIKAAPGNPVGRSSHGYKASAVVMLGHDDARKFTEDMDFVRAHARIRTA